MGGVRTQRRRVLVSVDSLQVQGRNGAAQPSVMEDAGRRAWLPDGVLSRGTAIAAMDEHDLEIFKANSRLDNERGIPSEILDVQQAREMAPLLSEEHSRNVVRARRRARQPAAHSAGIRVGVAGPGRARSPEHHRDGNTGRGRQGGRCGDEARRDRRGLRGLRRWPADEPHLRNGRGVGAQQRRGGSKSSSRSPRR